MQKRELFSLQLQTMCSVYNVHRTLEVVDNDNEYKYRVKKYASFHRKGISHWLNQNIAKGSEKIVLLSHLL